MRAVRRLVIPFCFLLLAPCGCRGLEPPEQEEWQLDEDIGGFQEEHREMEQVADEELLGS